MTSTVKQLTEMDVNAQEYFAVAIMVASIEVATLCPAPSLIKTLAEDDL